MLELKHIVKDYDIAGGKVHALKDVDLKFRRSEFVAVLGPSGCGKTTLLNIIGGLDKYTDGDLVIDGTSTKQYKDRDWDTYRNHSVGFIFQSYHLIPHQTILQNVELALTIGGVSKKERRERALDALDMVGLKERAENRPNQLSGGQMQRVAIARALINNPKIVLADEPTGALDTKTSTQIMDLLKEVAKDRLVIMVTHNPELAEQYATRIIRVLDGEVTDDSMPYAGDDRMLGIGVEVNSEPETPDSGEASLDSGEEGAGGIFGGRLRRFIRRGNIKWGKKNSSMSFGMAMALSFKNLLSKRRRTTLVAFAGSIGIIGISLVLALSSGIQGFIDDMENDMLSGYPITVEESTLDFSSLMSAASSSNEKVDIFKLDDKVYVDSLLRTLANYGDTMVVNNISDAYVSYVNDMPEEYYNAMQFEYEFDMSNNIYTDFYATEDELRDTYMDPRYASNTLSITAMKQMYTSILGEQEEYGSYASLVASMTSFNEMIDNYDYVMSQYNVLVMDKDGTPVSEGYTDAELRRLFEDETSLILVVDDSEVTDLNMAQFGYFSEEVFLNYAFYYLDENGENSDYYNGDYGLWGSLTENGATGTDENGDPVYGLDYGYFVGDNAKKFTWYSNDSIYQENEDGGDTPFIYKSSVNGGTYSYKATAAGVTVDVNQTVEGIEADDDALELGVAMILQKKDDISYGCLSSGMYYTPALTEHMFETARNSRIVRYIEETGEDLSMLPYYYNYSFPRSDAETPAHYILASSGYYLMESSMNGIISSILGGTTETEDALNVSAAYLGGSELPVAINIYPVDFDRKVEVTNYLDEWNRMCSEEESYTYLSKTGETVSEVLHESDTVNYTDAVGLIIGLVNMLIRIITIALICFTALSLVVSTVMIGVITYVSVVERVREIGILRAVGARKKDISRLFNSETFMIGLVAGLIGIILTYILSLIIDLIVGSLFGIYTIAMLPAWEAVVMVAVSVVLTLISGLIPASNAAKKDPVVALRTE